MTTEPEEEDVDSGWDVGGGAPANKAAPKDAKRPAIAPPPPPPRAAAVALKAPPKPGDAPVPNAAAANAAAASAPPPPGTAARKESATSSPAIRPPEKAPPGVSAKSRTDLPKPPPRKLGQSGETARLLADIEIEIEEPLVSAPPTAKPSAAPPIPEPRASAVPPSGAPLKARSFTPKVTNAVQQAKALDQEATHRPRRPTPMRVPTTKAESSAPPPPPPAEVAAKAPTTSLRFADKAASDAIDRESRSLGPKRKETLKFNRATQDFALDLLNREADAYSRRSAELGANLPADVETGEKISSPPLELHLGDWGEAPEGSEAAEAAPLRQRVPSQEPPPATTRSSSLPARPAPASPPPRLDRKAAGGLRTPGGPREATKRDLRAALPPAATKSDAPSPRRDVTRLDTPSSLSASAPPLTKPGDTAKPPPPHGEAPDVSLGDVDELELSDAEAAELSSLESIELDLVAPIPSAPAPSQTPVSKEPETVRGGPDDDPILLAVKERFERKDYMGALLRAEAILADKPDHAGAKFFATTCQDRVKDMYVASLGSGGSVPRLAMSNEAIVALALDHRSGFVISLVDGSATVDDILDISGMPMLEALRILYELKNEGIIGT